MSSKDVSFVRAVGLISGLTFVSRILGLIREAIFAYYFGISRVWDAYALAFTIPNLSRRLFGEGALSAAFIPVLSEKLHNDGRNAARNLTGGVLLLLGAVLTALVVVGELGIFVARQFHPSLTLSLLGTMLPYMVLICGVALLAGAQNVVGRFGHPAAIPILFNVVLISGVIAASYWAHDDVQHVNILAGAVLFAGVTQLALSWWALRKADFRPRLVWNPLDPDIKRIVSSMLPMMLGLGVVQINVLADRIVALMFVDEGGGVAALSYAERLYQLPLGLFGVALATAIFPQLSRFAASNDHDGFSETLARGLRLALFVGIPASVGLWAVREPAVMVIYQRGRLDPASALRVAKVVGFYGMGVWAYIFQQVILRAYYAQHHTKTPVRVASRMVFLNICLNLLLVHWLAEAGIALATAVTAALQVVILGRLFPRTGRSIAWRGVFNCGARVAAASALMYLAIVLIDRAIGQWGAGFSGAALQLGVLMAMGITVFAIAAKILLPEELRFIRHAFTFGDKPRNRA